MKREKKPRTGVLSKQFWVDAFWTIYRPIENALLWLNAALDGFPMRIYRAIDRFQSYGPHEAAALSYYALFSLFPLLLLLIVLSTSLLGTEGARENLSDILQIFFPGDTAAILQDAIESTQESRGSVTLFSFVVLAWSSANLFGNLEKVLNRVFEIEKSRRIYERRIVGIAMILMLGIFLVASLFTNVLFSFLGLLFLNQFNVWLTMASLFVPAAFNAAIFAMLYGYLPRQHLRWDAILPVSLIAGAFFEVAKRIFVWYLSNVASLDFVYGSVTTVVVFMFWAFLTFCLLLLGAEFCVAIDDWMERPLLTLREQSKPPMMLGEGRYFLPFDKKSQ